MTADDTAALLSQLTAQARNLASINNNDEARKTLIRTVHQLQLALETPAETSLRMTWGERGLDMSIQTAMAMKLFDALSDMEPRTSQQLGTTTNSDPVLISRLLKHMSAMDIVNETSSDHYTHTKFSKALTQPMYADAFPLMRLTADRANAVAPEFFAKSQFQNPQNPVDCAFQAGINEKRHFFEHVAMNPEIGGYFNNHMVGYAQGRKSWIDPGCYPVEEQLINGSNPEDIMLVDIGGGTGRDVNAFAAKFNCKCVLEELPEVTAVAVSAPNVQVLVHDMFNEQPIKGARAYYMHSLLHDWPDDKCIEILRNIKSAMKPGGYSKVLINENVVPKEKAYWMITGLDLLMMQVFASSERTEEIWQRVLESAGLKLTNIYSYEMGNASIIEAILP